MIIATLAFQLVVPVTPKEGVIPPGPFDLVVPTAALQASAQGDAVNAGHILLILLLVSVNARSGQGHGLVSTA